MTENENKLVNMALILSIITILYNILEGVFSIAFGMKDDSLALFGFGADSFVEVISGLGILHFTIRLKTNKDGTRDKFEKQALLITGISFLILSAGLIAGSILNFINKARPQTTVAGIVISLISLSIMLFLIVSKLKVGKKLNSEAVIADAKCSMTCFYLSLVLLASSLLFEIFRIGFIDIIGSLGIAFFALKEGIEAVNKSRKNSCGCSCSCGTE